MAEQIPVKAIRTGTTVTALAEFEADDTMPESNVPASIARISGATTIAVVDSLPADPDDNTIYITTT